MLVFSWTTNGVSYSLCVNVEFLVDDSNNYVCFLSFIRVLSIVKLSSNLKLKINKIPKSSSRKSIICSVCPLEKVRNFRKLLIGTYLKIIHIITYTFAYEA